MKRLCILLSAVAVLLCGCSAPKAVPETTSVTVPFQTVITVPETIQATQPEVVLESIPLVVKYDLSETQVEIHSFTAEETPGGMVRYTLDYTAPEGMELQVTGRNLSWQQTDYVTTGQRGTLIFELDSAAVRKLEDTMRVVFVPAEGEPCVLQVQTVWPEDVISAYEVSHLLTDLKKTGNVELHSLRVREGIETCHFTVEYTAVPGLRFNALVQTPEEDIYPFDNVMTTGQREIWEFDVAKDVLAVGDYMEICFVDANGVWVAANYSLPMAMRQTEGQPTGDPVRPVVPPENWQTGQYVLNDCVLQPLDNGYVRLTVDLSIPLCSFVTVYGFRGIQEVQLDQFQSTQERYQYVTDIPIHKLREFKSLSVLVGTLGGRSQYFEIPCGDFACTGGATVSEPVALAVTGMNKVKTEFCEVHACYAQLLDNGFVRCSVELTVPENTRITLFDPPNAEVFSRQFLAREGTRMISFDIAPEQMNILTEITLTAQLPGKGEAVALIDAANVVFSPEPVELTVISCT